MRKIFVLLTVAGLLLQSVFAIDDRAKFDGEWSLDMKKTILPKDWQGVQNVNLRVFTNEKQVKIESQTVGGAAEKTKGLNYSYTCDTETEAPAETPTVSETPATATPPTETPTTETPTTAKPPDKPIVEKPTMGKPLKTEEKSAMRSKSPCTVKFGEAGKMMLKMQRNELVDGSPTTSETVEIWELTEEGNSLKISQSGGSAGQSTELYFTKRQEKKADMKKPS